MRLAYGAVLLASGVAVGSSCAGEPFSSETNSPAADAGAGGATDSAGGDNGRGSGGQNETESSGSSGEAGRSGASTGNTSASGTGAGSNGGTGGMASGTGNTGGTGSASGTGNAGGTGNTGGTGNAAGMGGGPQLECVPGSTSCDGDQVLRCTDTGDAWVVDDTCGDDEYCDAELTACVTRVCEPLESRCFEGNVVECDELGSEETVIEGCVALGLVCSESECTDACSPATGGAQAGPALLHGFCWYLGDDGVNCDAVCEDVGGTNLFNDAQGAFTDSCSSPSATSLTKWFYDNDNPGGWSSSVGNTTYRTLGYGYRGGSHYGKCAAGTSTGNGAAPGDVNNDATRSLVCACFETP
ncbi:MAG TPA: hypothetical protein VF989_03245 [Polyangiaceae bacterium]